MQAAARELPSAASLISPALHVTEARRERSLSGIGARPRHQRVSSSSYQESGVVVETREATPRRRPGRRARDATAEPGRLQAPHGASAASARCSRGHPAPRGESPQTLGSTTSGTRGGPCHDDADEVGSPVEPAPQVVVLACAPVEKGAEVEALLALHLVGRRGPENVGLVRAKTDDLDGVFLTRVRECLERVQQDVPQWKAEVAHDEVAATGVCPVLGEHRQLPEQVLVEAAESLVLEGGDIVDHLRELLLALTDERRRLEPFFREEVADPRLGKQSRSLCCNSSGYASPPIVSRSRRRAAYRIRLPSSRSARGGMSGLPSRRSRYHQRIAALTKSMRRDTKPRSNLRRNASCTSVVVVLRSNRPRLQPSCEQHAARAGHGSSRPGSRRPRRRYGRSGRQPC